MHRVNWTFQMRHGYHGIIAWHCKTSQGLHGISNYRQADYCFFSQTTTDTSKLRRIPLQKANNLENFSMPLCHQFHSSFHGAAYKLQWIGSALVQKMACRLIGASHYLNQCWIAVNWTLRNKLRWGFNQNTKTSIMKMHLKLVKWRPICPGRNEMIKMAWVSYLASHDSVNLLLSFPLTFGVHDQAVEK